PATPTTPRRGRGWAASTSNRGSTPTPTWPTSARSRWSRTSRPTSGSPASPPASCRAAARPPRTRPSSRPRRPRRRAKTRCRAPRTTAERLAAAPEARRSAQEGEAGAGTGSGLALQPVRADGGVDLEGHPQGQRVAHHVDGGLHDGVGDVARRLEHQLVVHLDEQPGALAVGLQALVQLHHRHLDEVGRGALDHGVDRQPLAQEALVAVARPDLGDLAPAAEDGRDVAEVLSLLYAGAQEPVEAGVALLVLVDEAL